MICWMISIKIYWLLGCPRDLLNVCQLNYSEDNFVFTTCCQAVMGLCYFAFLALNKDEGSKGGGGTTSSESSTDDSLEEARRIMEKYK